MSLKKIGFAGLGIMGYHMASNLAKAGYKLTVYNRTIEKAKIFAKENDAEYVESSVDLIPSSDVIITMLSDPDAVIDVFSSKNGLLTGNCSGILFIDMSTVSVSTSKWLSDSITMKNGKFIDAPVVGSVPAAMKGELIILAGGTTENFEIARPILEKMGREVVLVGPSTSGTKIKIVNNFIMAVNFMGLMEGIQLGEAMGIDRAQLIDILLKGGAYSKVMELKKDAIVKRDFSAQFKLSLLAKDMNIAENEAKAKGVMLPVGIEVIHLVTAASYFLNNSADYSIIDLMYEEYLKKKDEQK